MRRAGKAFAKGLGECYNREVFWEYILKKEGWCFNMPKGLPENKPLSLYTLLAPHFTFLWRLLVSLGLIALAIIISS
jgi:hypothetical protein